MANKYPDYPPHQQRVFEEAAELRERITKLKAFIDQSANFEVLPAMDQALLISQWGAMTQYLGILDLRISRFSK
ncbi:TPA: hypothetical protein QHN36_003554 [Enterobacter bugandensis]|nr:hypothetical protein [Enterobacter bugandensis]